MDDSTDSPPAGASSATETEYAPPKARTPGAQSAALAGLQAGMMGALCMLAWLGIDSSLSRRGFWNDENLFATFFFGDDAIRAGFGVKTLPGLALYLIVYSVLGCIFALAIRNRLHPLRTMLAAVIFALGWFYLSFHILWKSMMPLVYLLYADRPMMVGHLIYGFCLSRFPGFLPGVKTRRETAPPAQSPGGEPREPAGTVPPAALE